MQVGFCVYLRSYQSLLKIMPLGCDLVACILIDVCVAEFISGGWFIFRMVLFVFSACCNKQMKFITKKKKKKRSANKTLQIIAVLGVLLLNLKFTNKPCGLKCVVYLLSLLDTLFLPISSQFCLMIARYFCIFLSDKGVRLIKHTTLARTVTCIFFFYNKYSCMY